jgi:hypothetical protein
VNGLVHAVGYTVSQRPFAQQQCLTDRQSVISVISLLSVSKLGSNNTNSYNILDAVGLELLLDQI